MGNKEAFIDLLHKYLSNDISAEEEQVFLKMVNDHADDPLLEDLLWESYRQSGEMQYWSDEYRKIFAARIMERIQEKEMIPTPAPVVVMSSRRRYAAAIAILILITAGAYFWLQQTGGTKQPSVVTAINEISPGKEGAMLTLADGRTITLDSMNNGIIAIESGTRVLLDQGVLSYDAEKTRSDETVWNTMSTPRGRQFQLLLPDGSRVWLNAASSIRYPTRFRDDQRLVEIVGEAYFEIEKNAGVPFKVKVNGGAEVEVLGTRFNINAYENEKVITTTLLEGSVRVNAFKQSLILKPRQQAGTGVEDRHTTMKEADINKVMAWKNGYFDFNNENLGLVLRQVERWYDIEIKYEGSIPEVIFQGKMDRNVQLSDVIRSLRNLGIETKLENRTLVIAGK